MLKSSGFLSGVVKMTNARGVTLAQLKVHYANE